MVTTDYGYGYFPVHAQVVCTMRTLNMAEMNLNSCSILWVIALPCFFAQDTPLTYFLKIQVCDYPAGRSAQKLLQFFRP
jgi:hypothetical protein